MKIEIINLQEDVSLISINNCKYILKKLLYCFDNSWCRGKNDFIQFLNNNGINTPITSTLSLKDGNYEIQNYVDGAKSQVFDEYIFKSLALFHNASIKYKKSFNKNLFNIDICIKNIKLNRLLLGFKEKFYTYPIKSLQLLEISQDLKARIQQLIDNLYNNFVDKYGISDCIIHNDLTSNNYIKLENSEYVFIDFDLSILSSVYVDIGDLIFTRNFSLSDYSLVFNKYKKSIYSYLDVYNAYSEKKVDFYGLVNYAALKLLSYYFYLHCKMKPLDFSELLDVLNFATNVLKKLKTQNKLIYKNS